MSANMADVIVVGGGGTGLMSAYAAARYGRSVILLEKGAQLGGTTRLSVGTICASSTALQRRAGIDDDPDAHFRDMELFFKGLDNRDNRALRRILVDEIPETIAILEDLGVEFMGPLPEPPHQKPRLHAIIPHSRGFIVHLEKACRKLGVQFFLATRADALIVEDQRVVGVQAHQDGQAKPAQFKARRGVILASGDFSAAELDYKKKYMTGALLEISGVNPLSTGDGQKMGEAVGGSVVNGDLAWGPEIRFKAPPQPSPIAKLPVSRWFAKAINFAIQTVPQPLMRPFLLGFVTTFLAPSPQLFSQGAILVNRKGERFCDERDRPQDAIGRQPQQDAFIIFDDAIAQKFNAWPFYISTAPGVGYAYLNDYERSRPDIFCKANDLKTLAEKLGLPFENFSETLASCNAQREADDALPDALVNGPFYALGPAISWIVFSEGGLKIDTEFRVLDQDNQPIEGLYAAGSAGQGGVLLEGHGHHLGWAFTSGRLAGRKAAIAPAFQA
jgi:succinate dehydrogenase/fumarate reductase flavoprotein subunit